MLTCKPETWSSIDFPGNRELLISERRAILASQEASASPGLHPDGLLPHLLVELGAAVGDLIRRPFCFHSAAPLLHTGEDVAVKGERPVRFQSVEIPVRKGDEYLPRLHCPVPVRAWVTPYCAKGSCSSWAHTEEWRGTLCVESASA